MKVTFVVLVVLLVLALVSGCRGEAESVVEPTPGFRVERLFTVDGCTVYRFNDFGSKYFTNCKGTTQWEESCGKNCTELITVMGGHP